MICLCVAGMSFSGCGDDGDDKKDKGAFILSVGAGGGTYYVTKGTVSTSYIDATSTYEHSISLTNNSGDVQFTFKAYTSGAQLATGSYQFSPNTTAHKFVATNFSYIDQNQVSQSYSFKAGVLKVNKVSGSKYDFEFSELTFNIDGTLTMGGYYDGSLSSSN